MGARNNRRRRARRRRGAPDDIQFGPEFGWKLGCISHAGAVGATKRRPLSWGSQGHSTPGSQPERSNREVSTSSHGQRTSHGLSTARQEGHKEVQATLYPESLGWHPISSRVVDALSRPCFTAGQNKRRSARSTQRRGCIEQAQDAMDSLTPLAANEVKTAVKSGATPESSRGKRNQKLVEVSPASGDVLRRLLSGLSLQIIGEAQACWKTFEPPGRNPAGGPSSRQRCG